MIVLTRPLPAARRFARALRDLGVDAPILFSPVIEIVPLAAGPLPGGTLVFTSENGVAAALGMGSLAGREVIAVGERTAAAARAAGANANVLGGDVAALGDAILAQGGGPYVHLHGRHVTGDLAGRLRAAGITAEGRAIYDQRARPLTDAARSALMGPEPVVLPLFSARSASLTAAALGDRPGNLHVVALGPKVLDSWPWTTTTLGADRTDMSAMADATVAAWRAARGRQKGRDVTNETETTPNEPTPETAETTEPTDDRTEPQDRSSGRPLLVAALIGGFLAGAAGYVTAYVTEFGLFQSEADSPVGAISDSLDTQAERLEALEQAFEQTGSDPSQAQVEETLTSVNEQVQMLSTRLEQIETAASGEPVDLSPVSDRLAGLEGQIGSLQELETRITDLQEQTGQQAAQIEEMSQTDRLDQLAQRVEELSATVQSQSQTIQEQQQAIQDARQSAVSEANRIAVQGALTGLRAALDTGVPYAEDLGALREATDVTVPEPLAAEAEDGVPTLNELRQSFPEPAREALTASIGATAGEGLGDRFGAFIRAQTSARSLNEQAGDGADAILSRAEARLDEGNLEAALNEIATLPEAGQEEMSDWTARARERLAATQAFSELNSSVTGN